MNILGTQSLYPPVLKRKLLIVLNYWDGDAVAAAELADLICDLQATKSELADFMLFRRNDAQPIHENVRQKLLTKFDKVHVLKCRRMNATGYPCGSNEMWYDLLDVMHMPEWTHYYYAFLNLESDCVPLDPDWIRKLCDEYRYLVDQEHFAIGHFQETPKPHLNGMAIYSTDFWDKAGGMNIIGGPAGVAYDFQHASRILPISKDTPLILLDYNRKTIKAQDLFSIKKANTNPVIFHGTKDASARRAVRAYFVEKRGLNDLSDVTIQTYFDPVNGIDAREQQRQIDLWREAWKAAGWNPIVNNRFDAEKSALFAAFSEKIKGFPSVNVGNYDQSCYLRWLAFEVAGAGLHSDYDVLPRNGFTPDKLGPPTGITFMQYRVRGEHVSVIPSLVHSDREGLLAWINYLMLVPAAADHFEGGKPHTSDMYILNHALKEPWFHGRDTCRQIGEDDWMAFPTVHFAADACRNYSPGSPKSSLMLDFLRGPNSQ